MNIALLHDGSYKFLENNKDITKGLSSIQYLVVDNSTPLKGKTYTMIDISKSNTNIFQKYNSESISLEMELSYDAADVPIDSDTIIKSEIPFSSIEKIFSVYPLVKQIFGLNFFKETYMSSDYISLYINSISIKGNDKKIGFDYNEFDGRVDRYFKELNIKTNVENILGSENHIVLKKGKWYISKNIPDKFEYVCYKLTEIETMYLLTKKQYVRLSAIRYLNINILDSSDYRSLGDYYIEEESDRFECEDGLYNMICTNLDSILEACIYFPQLIELEKLIYNRKFTIIVEVKTKTFSYNLTITEEELSGGLCLFKIINKLLQM